MDRNRVNDRDVEKASLFPSLSRVVRMDELAVTSYMPRKLVKITEEKSGNDPKWREYDDEMSVFVPCPGGLGKGKVA